MWKRPLRSVAQTELRGKDRCVASPRHNYAEGGCEVQSEQSYAEGGYEAPLEQSYAKALLSFAGSSSEIDEISKALECITSIITNEGKLRDLILDRSVSENIRKGALPGLLLSVSNSEVYSLLVGFLYLLIDDNAISVLPDICREFEQLMEELKKTLNIVIYSAMPLEEKQVLAIREKYEKLYNMESARVKTCIKPELLGGVYIQIGDTHIDNSLRGRLREAIAMEVKKDTADVDNIN